MLVASVSKRKKELCLLEILLRNEYLTQDAREVFREEFVPFVMRAGMITFFKEK